MPTFLALNGGAALVAVVFAVRLGLGARPSRLLLGALCTYLLVIHSLVLGAGLLGHLTSRGLAVLLAAAIAGVLWRVRGVPRAEGGADDGRVGAATRFAALVAIVALAVWAWPHLAEPARLWVWDDYTYHMVYPALWLSEHAIAAVAPSQAFTMQAWYPLSGSVVAAWFMTPFHGVRGEALAWVGLTGPLYAGIVASGAAELLGRLGCRRGAWAVPVALFATSDRIGVMASSFSDADLANAAALFAAFVFAVPRGDAESDHEIRIDTWYAALLTGFALGVKASAAPPALVVLLMVGWRGATASAVPGAAFRVAVRTGVIFLGAWAVTGGYWYVRNAVHTGNPLYPAAFLGWPGATFPETTLLEYADRYGWRRALDDALVVYTNWPRFHALVAAGGLLGLFGRLASGRGRLTRSGRLFACGALVITAAIGLLLPATPYSAGNAMTFRSGFVHWDSMRYVALLPILGWAALGFLLDAGAPAWRALAAAAVAAGGVLVSGLAPRVSPGALLALVPCAVLSARMGLPPGSARWRTPGAAAVAAIAATLIGAGLMAGSHRGKVIATAEAFHREPLFGAAAAVLDGQSPGARVAVFGDQWIYPAFGARHDLRPVRLDGDGAPTTAPIAGAMQPGDLTVDAPTLAANLSASGVDLVVVVHQPHPGRPEAWPAQHAALETLAGPRLLHRDRAVAIWRLTPRTSRPRRRSRGSP